MGNKEMTEYTEYTVAPSSEGESNSMLSINPTVFWSVANILILFILLRIFLFKPVNKIMEERAAAINKDLNDAKASKTEAEILKEEYLQTLEDARQEAGKIVETARVQAENERATIVRKADEEAQAVFAENAKTIEHERKRSVQAAQTQIADLAIAAATKIIGRSVDTEDNRRLVDEFLVVEGEDRK